MRPRLEFLVVVLLAAASAGSAMAKIVLDPPPEASAPAHRAFYVGLRKAVADLASFDDPTVRRVYAAAMASPGAIVFRPITADPSTLATDNDPDRGHTEPADGRPKRDGRSRPADAVIFLPMWGVEQGKRAGSGLLLHELVHALDMTTGRYSPDNRTRERRAVFVQNAWRARVRYELRTNYHGYFRTLYYQESRRTGRFDEYAEYLFTRNDFPDTAANNASTPDPAAPPPFKKRPKTKPDV
jgi:hypothetical protein